MSSMKKIFFMLGSLASFSLAAEKLEIGSKDLSHVENVSSLKDFKPSANEYRVYLIGDSITRHGFNKTTISKLKWGHLAGMAASSEDKDYAHLLAKKLSAVLTGKKISLFFGKGNNARRALTGIPEAQKYQPHLVIVQLGEHEKAAAGKTKATQDYTKLINALITLKSNPVIICTGVWSPQLKSKKYTGWAAEIEEIQRSVCKAANIPFASVEKYALDPKCSGTGGSKGVKWHPNDAGQSGYATAIFDLFKQYYNKPHSYKTIGAVDRKAAEKDPAPKSKIIYSENFNNGKSKLPVNPVCWKFSDGSLSAYGNKMAQINLNNLKLSNFSLDCKLRLLGIPADKKDGHCGFIMSDNSGKSVRIYFRRQDVRLLVREDKSTLLNEKMYTYQKSWPTSPDAKWNDVKLTVNNGNAELNINGTLAGNFEFPLKQVAKIQIYSYIVDCGIDDFTLKSLSISTPKAEPVKKGLAFYAKYDGTTADACGNITPDIERGIKYVPGISGQAVMIPVWKALLQYPADNLFADSGTVMFWLKPNWDGKVESRGKFPVYNLFTAQNGGGKDELKFFLWHWLRCDLPRAGLKPLSLQRKCRNAWLRGEWIHLAFTWNDSGWNKLYVNGLPYEHGSSRKTEFPFRSRVSLKNISRFCVGSIPGATGYVKNSDSAIDELKIYRGARSDDQVMAEYQRYMPVELVLERHYVEAGKPAILPLIAAPAGTFTSLPVKPCNLDLMIKLVERASGKTVWSKNYKNRLDKRLVLQLPEAKLAAGSYELECLIKTDSGTVRKLFKVVAYAPQPAPVVTDKPVKLGQPVISIDCVKEAAKAIYNVKPRIVSNYLQAGDEHGSRFAFKVDFPDKYLNNGPVMLEITWPDNAPRSMGLYMFPGITTFKQHRDRLEGGIQSGDEYPLTNKMITTRYIFYPSVKSYLFEARTFVNGMPAAVASFKVLPILERLPELKIDLPSKLPARRLGHMDEDQSFDYLMNWDGKERFEDLFPVKVVQKTCDYFAYTGQNTIAYPVLRYYYTLYARPGYFMSKNLLKPGFINLFLDIMHKRNIDFIGTINQYSLPEIYTRPDKLNEFKAKGYYAVDCNGKISRNLAANPVHPFIRSQFMTQFKELLLRFGRHPGFKGFDLWAREVWTFTSIKQGYGDFTVKLFSQETGIKLPEIKGQNRFHKRYELLTGKYRKQWLAWRAGKTVETVKLLVAEMRKVNPELELYINPCNLFKHPEIEAADSADHLEMAEFFYVSNAIDLKALNNIPNVQCAAMRNVTGYRWRRHWDNAETIYDELLYKGNKWKPFLKNGSAPTWNYNRYFETYKESLDPENFKSYFQNCDIKPWGRYFLKEWAVSLAQLDTDMMLMGGQPLGTAGRNSVTREFARAYRTLPALPFKQVSGMSDPVTVRYLNMNGQTWLYAVNTCWTPVTVKLNNITPDAIDLSSQEKISGKGFTINLKPYQLRSFKIAGTVVPQKGDVSIPEKYRHEFSNLITGADMKIDAIKKSGMDISVYKKLLNDAKLELEKKHYSAVMEILYSKQLRSLTPLGQAAVRGLLKQQSEMVKKGHIAVNLGSAAMQYYKAKDGLLFFPDRPYAPGSYGYSGEYKTVSRNVAKIKGTADPALFSSEAYDIDEYRFTVTPGTYTVKLYFKHGWKPSAIPGKFVINVDIEGKPELNKMDVFLESGSDFDRTFIKTIKNVKVKDGILDIRFSVPEGIDSTARLCNAIEVIRQ